MKKNLTLVVHAALLIAAAGTTHADLITAIEKAGYSGMVENQNLPHPSP